MRDAVAKSLSQKVKNPLAVMQEGFFSKGFDLEIVSFGQFEAATQAVHALASW
jgi:hypothetical protein